MGLVLVLRLHLFSNGRKICKKNSNLTCIFSQPCYNQIYGDIAQLGERCVRNAETAGSNPVVSRHHYGSLSIVGAGFVKIPPQFYEKGPFYV